MDRYGLLHDILMLTLFLMTLMILFFHSLNIKILFRFGPGSGQVRVRFGPGVGGLELGLGLVWFGSGLVWVWLGQVWAWFESGLGLILFRLWSGLGLVWVRTSSGHASSIINTVKL